jgi:hypothetical protein
VIAVNCKFSNKVLFYFFLLNNNSTLIITITKTGSFRSKWTEEQGRIQVHLQCDGMNLRKHINIYERSVFVIINDKSI